MEFRRWRDHFEKNRLRPVPELREARDGVPEDAVAPLARSLAVFQLGESKGGRLATEIDEIPGLTEDYRAAVKLFIGEEQRHGQLLAGCVEGLGGTLLKTTWTEHLFVAARRLLGVRFKLVVLLAAESVGLGFYRTLASRLPAGPLWSCLEEICEDEVHHLAFHGDAFRGRAWFRRAWYPVAGAATIVVLIDHRRTLRALGIPMREAAETILAVLRGVTADLRETRTKVEPEPREAEVASRAWEAAGR
jgi:hypothetical protein